jgi:hypothetical protein
MHLSRKAWIALAAAAVLAGLYAAVLVLAGRQLSLMLPGAIAEAVGGRDAGSYVVSIDDVRLSPLLNGVTVEHLVVSLDSAAAAESLEPALVRAADVTSLRVSGLKLLALLRGAGIYVSSIEIDGPTISLDFPAVATAGSPDSTTNLEPESAPTPTGVTLPNTTLKRVTIRDGSIDLFRATDFGTMVSFVHDLDLELTEITIDAVTLADPVAALANSRVTVAFDSVRHVLDDSLYTVTSVGFRADSQDSTMVIEKVEFIPTLEALPFFGRLDLRADRLRISAGPIRMKGLDFDDYIRDAALRVRTIDVDSLDLHVHSDIALDWGTRARPCRYHMEFATIPLPFRIDTIRVNDGFIRYSELAKGSQRAGELTFDEVNGSVTNLTNDPQLMTAATPAVVNATARLFGEGQVAATVRYPLLSPAVDFEVEAAVGPMSLLPANGFATNVTGVEIKRGQLDTLWVGLESRDGNATGRVHMRYRDLNFRLVDRNSGKEMAWHSVLGFAGNIAVRSNNPGKPQDQPREGKIEYSCGETDMVFFEFLVHSLATGLKDMVLTL